MAVDTTVLNKAPRVHGSFSYTCSSEGSFHSMVCSLEDPKLSISLLSVRKRWCSLCVMLDILVPGMSIVGLTRCRLGTPEAPEIDWTGE